MEHVLQRWDQAHTQAKEQVSALLASREAYAADFVQLARWCLTTSLSPYDFMPSGWAGSLADSVSAALFVSVLHHAMVDDGDVCFALSNTGPCLEFCDRYQLAERVPQHSGDLRKTWAWKDWSVEQFIHEVEQFHIDRERTRVERDQRRQQLLAQWAKDA